MSRKGRNQPDDSEWYEEIDEAREEPRGGRPVGTSTWTGGGVILSALVVVVLIWIAREPEKKDDARARFHREPSPVGSLAFSPDGRSLALGRSDGGLMIEGLSGERPREIESGPGFGVLARGLAFSPDGRTLASGGRGWEVRLWDSDSWSLRASLKGHTSPVGSLAFSPDGKTLASGSRDGSVKLWDLPSARELGEFPGHSQDVRGVAFSRDGKALATGSLDGSVKIWDVATGRELAAIPAGGRRVYGLAFAPDGKSLALGLAASTIEATGEVVLWTPAETRQPFRVLGPASFATVAFSPDGRTVAAAGGDRVVKLWDVETGQEIASLAGHEGTIASLSFSPDGQTLATAGLDSLVGLFELKPKDQHL